MASCSAASRDITVKMVVPTSGNLDGQATGARRLRVPARLRSLDRRHRRADQPGIVAVACDDDLRRVRQQRPERSPSSR